MLAFVNFILLFLQSNPKAIDLGNHNTSTFISPCQPLMKSYFTGLPASSMLLINIHLQGKLDLMFLMMEQLLLTFIAQLLEQ